MTGGPGDPYVENPIRNLLIKVVWTPPIEPLRDTLVVGAFALSWADVQRDDEGTWSTSAVVGIVNTAGSGPEFMASISLHCELGGGDSNSISLAGGLNVPGPGKDLQPYFVTSFGTFLWQGHPPTLGIVSIPVANVIEPPYIGVVAAQIYAPGTWQCDMSASLSFPSLALGAAINGTISCSNHPGTLGLLGI